MTVVPGPDPDNEVMLVVGFGDSGNFFQHMPLSAANLVCDEVIAGKAVNIQNQDTGERITIPHHAIHCVKIDPN